MQTVIFYIIIFFTIAGFIFTIIRKKNGKHATEISTKFIQTSPMTKIINDDELYKKVGIAACNKPFNTNVMNKLNKNTLQIKSDYEPHILLAILINNSSMNLDDKRDSISYIFLKRFRNMAEETGISPIELNGNKIIIKNFNILKDLNLSKKEFNTDEFEGLCYYYISTISNPVVYEEMLRSKKIPEDKIRIKIDELVEVLDKLKTHGCSIASSSL